MLQEEITEQMTNKETIVRQKEIYVSCVNVCLPPTHSIIVSKLEALREGRLPWPRQIIILMPANPKASTCTWIMTCYNSETCLDLIENYIDSPICWKAYWALITLISKQS